MFFCAARKPCYVGGWLFQRARWLDVKKEIRNDAFLRLATGDKTQYKKLSHFLATSWPKLRFAITECTS